MIKESSVWKWLRKLTEIANFHIMLHRIENVSGEGTPDVFFCFKGISGWIELKSWSELRKSQEIWAKKYLRTGGLLYLLYVDKDINVKILAKMELIDDQPRKLEVYPLLQVTEIPAIIWANRGNE